MDNNYKYFLKEKRRAKKLYKTALRKYNKVRRQRLTNKSTIDDVLKAQDKLQQESNYYKNICKELEDIRNGTFGNRYIRRENNNE